MYIHTLGTRVFIRDTVCSFIQNDGSILVLGVIVNRGECPATGVMIIATANDELTDLLDVREKEIGYLHPGQYRPFRIILRPQPGEFLNTHLYLSHDPLASPSVPFDLPEVSRERITEITSNQQYEQRREFGVE